MNKARFSWQSFRTALFIFLLLFILTSGVLWIFYHLEVQAKKNILQIQASHTINLQKSRIAHDFSLIVADLLFFANYSQLLAMLKDSGSDKLRLTNDLVLFSRCSKIYDQVRIINAEGKEGIRVNFIAGKGPVIVKEENLQLKKERYYFQDTFRLQKGEIFISPLDLNIEHGEVEKPLKPMIRFGTPIFNEKGQKRGIVILNYLAANLIKDMKDLVVASSLHSMMLNSDGYWLTNKSFPNLEWGFMFKNGKGLTMQTQEPKTWRKITAADSGQFSNEKGLYTFTTVYPLLGGWRSSTGASQAFTPSLAKKKAEEYFWKIVLYLPKDLLTAAPDKILTRYILLSVAVFILLSVGAFLLVRAKLIERQAVKDLHQSHMELETRVKARTAELEKASQALKESETLYVDLYDNAPDMFFSVDVASAEIVQCNQSVANILGYSKEEIVGQPVFAICHPECLEKVKREVFPTFAKTGESKDAELQMRRKDGTKVEVIVNASAVRDENGKIIKSRSVCHDITTRKSDENALRQAKNFSETIISSMLDAIAIINVDNFTIQQVNPAFLNVHELMESEVLGRTCYEVTHNRSSPCADPDYPCPFFEALEKKDTRIIEHTHYKKDGGKIFEEVCTTPLRDKSGKIVQIIHVSRDITERKKLQEQYLQAQKMESVGRLVGGVAHDFNNLLTTIIGYSELTLQTLPADNPGKKHIDAIYQAGKRAAGLTQQLLAFSRKQVMEMKSVDINKLIDNLDKMLGRMIGEDVKLILHTKSSVGNIKADPTQMEQVIINLAVNARDAMPNGGFLILETTIVTLDDGYDTQIPQAAPGSYVRLTVTDTGEGMTKAVQEHIFEPFFTTKSKERGTGLGLATIYGIIKQHNGHIHVYSETDKGTVFNIYLPRSSEPADQEIISNKQRSTQQGTETILVVDDDPQIVRLVTDCILPLGYKIFSACGTEEAIEICENTKEQIDLLVTDVVMPEMNGLELAEVLCKARPDLKVVFMSGYTNDVITHHGFLEDGVHYINKPLRPGKLISKVRDVLDGME